MLKKSFVAAVVGTLLITGTAAYAADYQIDTKGQHAFVNFRINHLGYSWIYGGFNKFSGTFSYDKNNAAVDKVAVTIDTDSLTTNMAARDEHVRSADLLDVKKFPQATFESTKVIAKENNKLDIEGNLTLHGVTKPITINAELVGEGTDPWGGYRAGFLGTTRFKLKDFGIDYDLGPATQEVEMTLSIEGVRQ